MTTEKPKHIGRNIARIRELRGFKQDALAFELGISQQTISNMEKSEEIDDKRLSEVAKVLGVTPEAIKNFSEDAVFNIIGNTFENSQLMNSGCTFNPLDKVVELYERLVQAEKDKVAYLEKLMEVNKAK